jgi:hypothetical protein
MLAGEATQGHRTVTDCRVGKEEGRVKKLSQEIYRALATAVLFTARK